MLRNEEAVEDRAVDVSKLRQIGASDAKGAYPTVDPVTPADLAATIYWRFGFDPEAEMNPETRDFAADRLAAGAQMLAALWWSAWLESASPAGGDG